MTCSFIGWFGLVSIGLVLLAAPADAQPALQPDDEQAADPVRIVVIGATHAHVHWVLGEARRDRGDFTLVGIYEPDEDLAQRLIEQHGLDPELHYTDLDAMLDATDPEAACLFGSIFDHRDHAIYAAEHGLHVMVEKPLAVNMDHARAMADAARANGVHLLTNYETTWYPWIDPVKELIDSGQIGAVRRVVACMGHQGPREIGCGEEFLAWLTDPVLNGGGALTDFGCYGANLATWLMDGQRPVAVTAVTRQFKPDVYPNVDDDATITIEYADAVVTVMASWNWPMSRKDLEVFGATGSILTQGRDRAWWGDGGQRPGHALVARHNLPRDPPRPDPFSYLAGVVRGTTEPGGLSGLDNNLLVVEILDAGRASAAEGVRVELPADAE